MPCNVACRAWKKLTMHAAVASCEPVFLDDNMDEDGPQNVKCCREDWKHLS